MNTQEYWEKQVLFACRQNQPAGYGFYFPAMDDHEDEDTLTSKMVCIRCSVTPIQLVDKFDVAQNIEIPW
jgi:hypothetical protein